MGGKSEKELEKQKRKLDKEFKQRQKDMERKKIKDEKKKAKEEKERKDLEAKEKKREAKAKIKANSVQVSATLEDFRTSADNPIPLFLEKALTFIEKEGLDAEGLYRVPGNRAHVDLLLQKFDEGKPKLLRWFFNATDLTFVLFSSAQITISTFTSSTLR